MSDPGFSYYDVFLDRLSEKARAGLCWNTAERLYDHIKHWMTREPVAGMPDWEKMLKTIGCGDRTGLSQNTFETAP